MALAWEPCLATMLIKHCDRCTYRYTGTETALASSTLLPLALALACMPAYCQPKSTPYRTWFSSHPAFFALHVLGQIY